MLSSNDIELLDKMALGERKLYELGDISPIGVKIFNIIENIYSSYILLYPLKTESVAGFTRKSGEVVQVFINTGFNTSFQVFAAAHELYHLIQFKKDSSDDFIVCDNTDISETIADKVTSSEEIKANYFAAAFLLPGDAVKERFSNVKNSNFIEEDMMIEIIKIQAEYEVPYKTILKRLSELKIISNSEFQKLIERESDVLDYCKMLDTDIEKQIYNLENTGKRKYHTLNVPKIAFDVYRNNIISISKFESIISQYDKSLSDFKVTKEEVKPVDIDFSKFGIGEEGDGVYDED